MGGGWGVEGRGGQGEREPDRQTETETDDAREREREGERERERERERDGSRLFDILDLRAGAWRAGPPLVDARRRVCVYARARVPSIRPSLSARLCGGVPACLCVCVCARARVRAGRRMCFSGAWARTHACAASVCVWARGRARVHGGGVRLRAQRGSNRK